MKCQARILKENKSRKNRSIWPMYCPGGEWIPNPMAEGYPVCEGDVTVKLVAYADGCGCCGGIELEWDARCTKCDKPFYLAQTELPRYMGREIDVTKLLEAYEKGIK